MRSTLLSDAHLNAIDDPRQEALVQFMAQWQTDQWVFVGDILDFGWSGEGVVYWAHVPFWAAVLSAIGRGQSVVWVRGNHDFAVHSESLQQIGVEVVDQWSRQVDGRVVGALHGDHAPDGGGARTLRRLALGPAGRGFTRVVGASNLLKLGHWASKTSKKRHTAERLQFALDRQAKLVQQKLGTGWDVCCVGHTHAPGTIRSAQGVHVNLGDWSEHRTFAQVDDKLSLLRWSEGEGIPVEGPPRRRLEWGVKPC